MFDDNTNCCALCVAVNRTVYRSIKPPLMKIHPNCRGLLIPYLENNDIKLNFPSKKITEYLFVDKDKSRAMKSMGYYPEDWEEVYDFLKRIIISKYYNAEYILRDITIHGQRLTISFTLDGKRDHKHQKFLCHVGCIVYPNKCIKVITPLILDKIAGGIF